MPAIKTQGGSKKFITIVGGKLRQTVEESVEGAVIRHYETSDGKKGSKYELVYDGWSGIITHIEFKDGTYGKVCNIHFDDVIIQVSKSSKYFSGILEKLPNVNFQQGVTLKPYDFEDDNGKRRTGVSVQQNGEKIPGFFFDGKKSMNGIPDGSNVNWKDEDERKVFFITRDKFLIDYTEENVINKISAKVEEIPTIEVDADIEAEFKGEDVDIESVPF